MSNVILLMSDEHNPFYSSFFGHPFVKTPHMENLAKRGTLFRNAYCSSPLCTPSRAAFMTGKRVHELQTYSNCKINVNQHRDSFGKVLSEQGVHTVLVGNSGMYDGGFSETYLCKESTGSGDTNISRRPLAVREGAGERADHYGIREGVFDADVEKIAAAVGWLKEKGANQAEPWVLVVNVSNPHFPLWNTQEFWDMYSGGGDLPEHGTNCESAQHPYAQDLRRHFETEQFTEEQVKGLRRGYYGNVSFVDQQLGRLTDAMEEADLQDNTNFMYVADHGEMLGKFGLWWKSCMYEDSLRVPCIAAGPDFGSGKTLNTPVDLLDVQASLFQSVGVEKPDDRLGTPLQYIPENDSGRVVFSEYHGHGTRSGAYMVRKGDWKLIYYAEAPHQLFHLSEDPEEVHNVFTECPEKACELEAELRKFCSPEEESEKAHEFQERQIELLKR